MNGKQDTVTAKTTKEFFIYMLTKDIELVPAIVDLIDNAVDAARGHRNREKLTGYWCHLEFDKSHFRVRDNGGGMTVKVARDRAFYFGRPHGIKPDPGTIGLFGIGMKRAIFKLGKGATVESTTDSEHFAIKVDVDDWLTHPDEWWFPLEMLDPPAVDAVRGVDIRVNVLNDSVSKDFELNTVEGRLIDTIAKRLAFPISQGFEIKVNGHLVEQTIIGIRASDLIEPGVWVDSIPGPESSMVSAQIVAGLGESEPKDAGWYLYCNGRLVVGPDQSGVTGWGRELPQMHPQYARFRGYALFRSDDARALPWDTTKTGIDEDSSVFRTAREHMVKLSLPVKVFLDKLALEAKDPDDEEKPLAIAANTAPVIPLTQAAESQPFKAPDRPKATKPLQPKPDLGVITYYKPRKKIEKAKRVLGVNTQPEVGQKTFDYFFEKECTE
jgi:hypothetical protein